MSSPPDHPTRAVARVLIVDDSAAFMRAARELLEQRGYVVVGEASSAAGALDAVEVFRPDAALIDLKLPDADGVDLAIYLATHQPAVSVLLMSADSDRDPMKLVEQTQAAGFTSKSELARVDLGRFWPRT